MNASEKWMIFQFTPHQTTTLPKWIFFQKIFFKSSFLLNGYSAAFKNVPQTAATTFAFSFLFFFFYAHTHTYPSDTVGRGEDDAVMDEHSATPEDIILEIRVVDDEVGLPGKLVHLRIPATHQLGQQGRRQATRLSEIVKYIQYNVKGSCTKPGLA